MARSRPAARIDSLTPLARDPSLVRIVVDGEEAGVLLRSTVEALGLRAGRSVSKALAERIRSAVEVARARSAALKALASRDRSSRRLAEFLVAKGFDQCAAKEAVDGLQEDGWIDDTRFAQERARSLLARKPVSHAFLTQTLLADGVGEEVAVSTARRAAPPRDDLRRALVLAEEAKGRSRSRSPAGRVAVNRTTARRIASLLARAGFEADTIAAALDSIGFSPIVEGDS